MSKRYLTLIAVTAFSLSTVTDAAAQSQNSASAYNKLFSQDYHYNWDFTGGGARAAALGGAYTALSDDPHGLSWNPAGIVGLEEIYISFDWSTFNPGGTFDYNSGAIALDHEGNSGSYFNVGSLTAPLTVKNQQFTLGLAFSRAMDTYSLFSDKVFAHPTSPLDLDISYERDGYLNIAHLGGATRVSEKIRVGATANIHFGKVVIDQRRTQIYQNQLDSASLQTFQLSSSIRQLDSFNLSGLNFTLGMIADLSDETRLGLTIKTPFKMGMSDDVSVYDIIEINNAPDPDAGSDTLIASDRESQVEIPLIVTLGLAHNWSERFMTSVDLGYRSFSSSNFLVFDSTKISPQGNQEVFRHDEPTNWSNVIQLRLGGEYTVETKYGLAPLRAGFGFLQQPFRDVSEYGYQFSSVDLPLTNSTPWMPIPTQKFDSLGRQWFEGADQGYKQNKDVDRSFVGEGDRINALSFSLGFGLHSDQRKIDFAYSYTTYSQSYTTSSPLELISGTDPVTGKPIPYDPLSADNPNLSAHQNQNPDPRVSENTMKDHRFMVSFTGYF